MVKSYLTSPSQSQNIKKPGRSSPLNLLITIGSHCHANRVPFNHVFSFSFNYFFRTFNHVCTYVHFAYKCMSAFCWSATRSPSRQRLIENGFLFACKHHALTPARPLLPPPPTYRRRSPPSSPRPMPAAAHRQPP